MHLLPASTAGNPLQALRFTRSTAPKLATVAAVPSRPQPSPLAEVVAERGFPASFQGFTPQDRGYWVEPGLPFMGACPTTVEEMEAFRVTHEGTYHMQVPADDQRMAPRFMAGASLALRPILRKQDIVAGVYVWQRDVEGEVIVLMARLKQMRRGKLLLAYDNGGQERNARLRWSDPTFRLFRVIGYNSIPVV